MRLHQFVCVIMLLFCINIDSMKRPLIKDIETYPLPLLPKEIWIHIIACSSVKNKLRETCLYLHNLASRKNRELLLHDQLQLSYVDMKKFVIYYADCGDNLVIKNILFHDGDPNEIGDHGMSLMSYAIRNKDIKMAHMLLENSKIKIVDSLRGQKFLNDYDLQKNSVTIHKELKTHKQRHEALVLCAKTNNDIGMNGILSNLKKKHVYKYKKTALSLASQYGSVSIVQNLLQQGVSPDFYNLHYSGGPLHIAAYNGYTYILKLLIEHGALVNSKNSSGFTPLHCAVKKGYINSVQFLIDNGALINIKGGIDDETPLMLAVKLGFIKIVELLLTYDAYINETNRYNDTVLHYAAYYNRTNMVHKLLSYSNICVNIRNRLNETPLDLAINNQNIHTMKFLHNKGGIAGIYGDC